MTNARWAGAAFRLLNEPFVRAKCESESAAVAVDHSNAVDDAFVKGEKGIASCPRVNKHHNEK
jgi:hypothetical protein